MCVFVCLPRLRRKKKEKRRIRKTQTIATLTTCFKALLTCVYKTRWNECYCYGYSFRKLNARAPAPVCACVCMCVRIKIAFTDRKISESPIIQNDVNVSVRILTTQFTQNYDLHVWRKVWKNSENSNQNYISIAESSLIHVFSYNFAHYHATSMALQKRLRK